MTTPSTSRASRPNGPAALPPSPVRSSYIGLLGTVTLDIPADRWGALSGGPIGGVHQSALTAALDETLLAGQQSIETEIAEFVAMSGQGDSGGAVAFRFIGNRREQGSTVNSSTPFLAFYRF